MLRSFQDKISAENQQKRQEGHNSFISYQDKIRSSIKEAKIYRDNTVEVLVEGRSIDFERTLGDD